MKPFFITVLIVFNLQMGYGQQTRYQTNKAALKISAMKAGENYQWENKDITVFLDYRNGDFITRLKNTDFRSTLHPEFHEVAMANEMTEYIFKGILPITEMIDQRSINQTYPVELQLICEGTGLDETVGFQMTVTRPGGNSGNYRIFSLQGKLYNKDLLLPAFSGFDDEIEIWIVFNAISNTN